MISQHSAVLYPLYASFYNNMFYVSQRTDFAELKLSLLENICLRFVLQKLIVEEYFKKRY